MTSKKDERTIGEIIVDQAVVEDDTKNGKGNEFPTVAPPPFYGLIVVGPEREACKNER